MPRIVDCRLRDEPIVTFGSLGRVLDVGAGAARSAAQRLGIEPTRLGNGREYISVEQAEQVARVISDRASG